MLRAILLNKQKRELQIQLDELRKTDLKKREEELGQAIEETQTEEEQLAVEEEIKKYEEEKEAIEIQSKELEGKIKAIDDELEELEEKHKEVKEREKVQEKREGEIYMVNKKLFGGFTREQAMKITQREDVQRFLMQVRIGAPEAKGGGIKNANLLIPEILVGILRDNIHQYSKLLSKVWMRALVGKARVIVPGTIPEAVWTEACAKLNELSISFNDIEMDGYKVGGYIPICKATLKDATDVDLWNEIMYMLAQAIGLALDKAILYGTGQKMPLGILTRLAQKSEPGGYSKTSRKWEDLSTKNILKATGTKAEELFADIVTKSAAAKSNYSNGVKFWAMNETTWTMLQSKLVTFNASGAVVSSMNMTMPILGGDIVILPFIPDGDIIGGYGNTYLLVERDAMELEYSEHVQFLEENIVFKGTARYDGAPVIAESFVAININGGTVKTTMEFAEDKANTTPGA